MNDEFDEILDRLRKMVGYGGSKMILRIKEGEASRESEAVYRGRKG